jgi:hypothetical protein
VSNQASFFNDPGANHTSTAAGARATAKQAAINAYPRSGTQRAKVLNVLTRTVVGLTDEEMQTLLGMGANTQRPRRVELVDGGFIEDSGQRRPTSTHSQAIVWRTTPKGQGKHDA